MSYALPQEAKKSKKFTSLPDDLSKIAEKLMKSKFKEELPVDPREGFPGTSPYGREDMGRCGNSFCATCYGGIDPCRLHDRYNTRGYDGLTSRVYRTDRVSLEALYELVKRLDYENAPRNRREWRMGRREFEMLARDARFGSVARAGSRATEIFGIPVNIIPGESYYIELSCIW